MRTTDRYRTHAQMNIDPRRLLAANADAAAFYATQLPRSRSALAYLQRRGIEAAARPDAPWQLGYAAPGWRTLTNELLSRGYSDDELYAAGLVVPGRHSQLLDRFRDRLTFPVHDPQGQVIGFTARDLSSDPQVAKYINGPDTAVYHKGRTLYGLGPQQRHPVAGDRPPLAVTVEGPTDAIAVDRMGQSIADLPGATPIVATAPCGTALTTEQVRLLRDTLPEGTSLAAAFDGDPAGRRAFDRAYRLLRDWPGRAYGIQLPDDTDPADLLAQHGPAGGLAQLAARITPAARQAMTNRLDQLVDDGRIPQPLQHTGDRLTAYQAVAGYFIDDPGDTKHLAQAAADRLGLDPGEVGRGVVEQVFPPSLTEYADAERDQAAAPPGRAADNRTAEADTGQAMAKVQRDREAVTARTFPDAVDAQFQPAQVAAKVQRAHEAVAARADQRNTDPALQPATAVGRHTTRTTEGGSPCLTTP